MKKASFIHTVLAFGATLILLLGTPSCTKEQDIMCEVTFIATLPDGSSFLSMEVDPAPKGNFLRNLNTRQDFDFPVFVNGTGQIRVLRGMYYLAFDAEVMMPDGTRKNVRCAQYNSPEKSLPLLGAQETVSLQLTLR